MRGRVRGWESTTEGLHAYRCEKRFHAIVLMHDRMQPHFAQARGKCLFMYNFIAITLCNVVSAQKLLGHKGGSSYEPIILEPSLLAECKPHAAVVIHTIQNNCLAIITMETHAPADNSWCCAYP